MSKRVSTNNLEISAKIERHTYVCVRKTWFYRYMFVYCNSVRNGFIFNKKCLYLTKQSHMN